MEKAREVKSVFALGIIRGSFIYYWTHEGFAVAAVTPQRSEE